MSAAVTAPRPGPALCPRSRSAGWLRSSLCLHSTLLARLLEDQGNPGGTGLSVEVLHPSTVTGSAGYRNDETLTQPETKCHPTISCWVDPDQLSAWSQASASLMCSDIQSPEPCCTVFEGSSLSEHQASPGSLVLVMAHGGDCGGL